MKEKEDTGGFFDIPEGWEEHWQGMPEFVQEDKMPLKTIYVHFKSEQDIEAFAKLVKQKITLRTKFIWYPKAKIAELTKLKYIDSKKNES